MDGKVCCLPRVLQYQYERGKISCRRLEWEGGAVSSRVALLLRSAEAQPYLPRFVRFSELFFFFLLLLFLYVLNVKPDVCLVYFTRVCVCGFWPGGQGKKKKKPLLLLFSTFSECPCQKQSLWLARLPAPGSRLPVFFFICFPPLFFVAPAVRSSFSCLPVVHTNSTASLARNNPCLSVLECLQAAGRKPQAASRKPACAKKC